MFRVRDYSLFRPSPNAKRAFARLRALDMVIRGLLIVLAIAACWNIVALVRLRMIQNQDFTAIKDIANDPSSWLIWILVPTTLGVIAFREWLSGEHSLGIMYPLGALLAVVVMPAAMIEMQPRLVDHTLRMTMMECPAKAIVNGEVASMLACGPVAIDEDRLLMATSDPGEGEFETIPPAAGGQNTITFQMQGRGTYTVYFMFRQDDMAACSRELVFSTSGILADAPHECVMYNGHSWLVMPYVTSGSSVSGIHLVRVRMNPE